MCAAVTSHSLQLVTFRVFKISERLSQPFRFRPKVLTSVESLSRILEFVVAVFQLVRICDACHWCMNCGTGRSCQSVMLYFCVCIVCHAFGLWDCPGLPLLLSAQTCNTVFLESAAHSAVLSISFPKSLRILVCVQPIGGLCRSLDCLFPRCPRCACHALDETTVPNFLIILCSN